MDKKPENRALVLLSGGLDSAASLVYAAARHYKVTALFIEYGQRASKRELAASGKIARYCGAGFKKIKFPVFSGMSDRGALLDRHNAVPDLLVSDIKSDKKTEKSAAAVWVPQRNLVFLSVAAAIAESEKIGNVYAGFNSEEAGTFPDNSAAFLKAMNGVLGKSSNFRVRIAAPFINHDKTGIVSYLLDREFPLSLLWSCYHGHEKICGQCESCVRFKLAVDRAEIKRSKK